MNKTRNDHISAHSQGSETVEILSKMIRKKMKVGSEWMEPNCISVAAGIIHWETYVNDVDHWNANSPIGLSSSVKDYRIAPSQ